MRALHLFAGAAALAAAAPLAQADTIYMVDGRIISDVSVESDGLHVVAYQEGRSTEEVPAEDVLRIEYERVPKQVDEAQADIDEGNLLDGAAALEDYVTGVVTSDRPQRRYPHAPPAAMYRLVEVYAMLGRKDEVVRSVDRLLEHAPQSRFVPHAYLRKAEVLAAAGEAASAAGVLKELEQKILNEGMSPRWELEKDLAAALLDESLKGDALRRRLNELAQEAGSKYPVVRNRAEVAVGESHLESGELDEAEEVFRNTVDDPKADDSTLAAAYAGLGECLYRRAASENDTELMKDALLKLLRVAVIYEDETRYAPKAMFYAGRAFDFLNDEPSKERAQKMYRKVIVEYGGSSWADEAKAFIRRS